MPVFASMTLASVLPCWRMAILARTELLVEVEEAVPIPEACELIDHDRLEQGTHIGAGDEVLGHTAFEGVNVVDVAVSRLELVLDLNVAGDLRKAGHGWKSQGDPDLVVRPDAVIPSPLDVESDEILAEAHARNDLVEQEVPDPVDGLHVLCLSVHIGIAFQDSTDVRGGQSGDRVDGRRLALAVEDGRVEKVLSQGHVCRDGQTIVALPLRGRRLRGCGRSGTPRWKTRWRWWR